MNKLIITTAITLFSVVGSSHSRLSPSTGVVPRTDVVGNVPSGNKTGPCGGLRRVTNAPTLTSGQKLTVNWEETINHPGRYEFYFSTDNGATFTQLASIPDTQDDSMVPHFYTTELTLPNVTCTQCTLQMIQVMMENPTSPSLYYSCADMQMNSTGAPPPGPSPSPSPLPKASPTPIPPGDCH